MSIRRPRYVVIDGCPCPTQVAPYVYLVLRQAGQTASSIYRGNDRQAVRILHRHGKHTQAEIHRMYPAISNPPGQSEHDLHSDGFANPGPVGRQLEPWQVGIDSGTDSTSDKTKVAQAGHHYGLQVRHPYSRGVEGHHWCLAVKPRPNRRLPRRKVIATRARLYLAR